MLTVAFRDFFLIVIFPYQTRTCLWSHGSWQPQNPILAPRTRTSYSTHQSHRQLLMHIQLQGFPPTRGAHTKHLPRQARLLLRGVGHLLEINVILAYGKFLKSFQISVQTWVSSGLGSGEMFLAYSNRHIIFTNIKLVHLINPLGPSHGFCCPKRRKLYSKTTDLSSAKQQTCWHQSFASRV